MLKRSVYVFWIGVMLVVSPGLSFAEGGHEIFAGRPVGEFNLLRYADRLCAAATISVVALQRCQAEVASGVISGGRIGLALAICRSAFRARRAQRAAQCFEIASRELGEPGPVFGPQLAACRGIISYADQYLCYERAFLRHSRVTVGRVRRR